MVRESLPDEGTFAQKPERDEGTNHSSGDSVAGKAGAKTLRQECACCIIYFVIELNNFNSSIIPKSVLGVKVPIAYMLKLSFSLLQTFPK